MGLPVPPAEPEYAEDGGGESQTDEAVSQWCDTVLRESNLASAGFPSELFRRRRRPPPTVLEKWGKNNQKWRGFGLLRPALGLKYSNPAAFQLFKTFLGDFLFCLRGVSNECV